MIPEPLFEPVHFQQELDTLRKKVNCDFAAVALYENHEPSGPIKCFEKRQRLSWDSHENRKANGYRKCFQNNNTRRKN